MLELGLGFLDLVGHESRDGGMQLEAKERYEHVWKLAGSSRDMHLGVQELVWHGVNGNIRSEQCVSSPAASVEASVR